MNITFFIGNGFDINLDLETSYQNFYENYYLKKKPAGIIADSISKEQAERNNPQTVLDYKEEILWSNLELGIGKITKSIDVDSIDSFLDEKELLEQYLAEYLRIEQNKMLITDENKLGEEVKKKIQSFHLGLNTEDRESYINVINSIKGSLSYHFINFNYTNTLDRIIATAIKKSKNINTRQVGSSTYNIVVNPPIHIHATLDEGILIGIDNESQIRNESLRNNHELNDNLIKKNINKLAGERRTEKVQSIVDSSVCIGLYGLSLGDTDKMWWQYIGKWLQKSSQNRLIIFDHHEKINTSQSAINRKNNSQKRAFLAKADISPEKTEELLQQISIIYASQIFTYDNITKILDLSTEPNINSISDDVVDLKIKEEVTI